MADRNCEKCGAPSQLVHARRTHCKRGHPLSAENVLHVAGRRLCRICNVARAIAHNERRLLGRRATA